MIRIRILCLVDNSMVQKKMLTSGGGATGAGVGRGVSGGALEHMDTVSVEPNSPPDAIKLPSLSTL